MTAEGIATSKHTDILEHNRRLQDRIEILTIPLVSPILAKSRQRLRTSHRAEKLTTAQSPILAGSAYFCL